MQFKKKKNREKRQDADRALQLIMAMTFNQYIIAGGAPEGFEQAWENELRYSILTDFFAKVIYDTPRISQSEV